MTHNKINKGNTCKQVINGLLLLILTCSSMANTSNDRYVNITHFDVYKGLAGNKVTQIGQDTTGYLWFGTHSGMTRYDSKELLNFKHDTMAVNSLPANEISLFHIVNNEMWIGLNNVGLARFNLAERSFSMVPITPGKADGIEHSVVFAITSDQEDNVWIFQFDHGISVYEQSSQNFTHYTPENASWLTSSRFFDAKLGVDGMIWVATLEGKILSIDPSKRSAQEYLIDHDVSDSKSGRMYSLSIANDGQVFASGYQGVYRFNDTSEQFELMISDQHIIELMGDRYTVRNVLSDSQGHLWLSTRGGLLLYKEGQLNQIKFLNKGKPVLTNFEVRMVFEDREGSIWLATNENGAMKLNRGWDQFNIYLPFAKPNNPDNAISNYLSDHGNFDDTFWLLNKRDNSLSVYRYQRGRISQSQVYDERHELPDNIISMYQDSDFRLWLATELGLYVYDWAGKKFVMIESDEINGGVTQLFEAGDTIYFNVYGDRHLYAVNKIDLAVVKLEQQLMNDILSGFVKGPDGNFWLLGNHGIEKFNPVSYETTTIFESDKGVEDIEFDRDNSIVWLVSNGTILKFKLIDDQLIEQDVAGINAQISKEFIDTVQLFGDQLWLGSNNGVISIDQNNFENANFITVDTNLPSNYIIGIIELYDQSKMIFTDSGMAHLKKPLTLDVPIKNPLVMSKATLNDELAEDLSALSYNYGSLAFSYQLLSYTDINEHQYQYRLKPDAPWINAGSQTRMAFYQLSPDNYYFQVRARNRNGDWSDPIGYEFTVLPPPWNSQLAYFLYVMMGLAILAIILYVYRKRWQYNARISQAKEKQAFAETQLSLTTSLVSSLEIDELLEKIKQEVHKKVKADAIEVCYWNSKNNYQIFSDKTLSTVAQNELGAKALTMYEQKANHLVENIDQGSKLWVLFSHSADRIGLIQLTRLKGTFNQTDISLSLAYAMQSSLALENARLFEEINYLAEQANASNQAKSDFLAQVSHEVRTPMNGILGMNELLLDTELNEEQQLYASAVAESGEHLLHIINDILDLSKIEAGELVLEERPINLLALVDEVVKSFVSVSQTKKVLFWSDFSFDVAPIRMVDSVRVKQILMNLLSNAFKFTSSGEISLSVMPSDQPEKVMISVKDTGIGIKAELLDSLFEPFTQADSSITRKFGGTGLGLSIVKKLTEKMGGEIAISSQQDGGTEVVCTIPLRIAESKLSIKPDGRQVKILGQNEDHIQGLKHSLGFAGVSVVDQDSSSYDALFVFDEEEADYSKEIAIANRNLLPVYLLAPVYQSNHYQSGTFRLVNVPFTFDLIEQLFKTKSKDIYCEVNQTKPSTQLHLLVVEDNPINQQLLLELLEKEGHVVDIFDDANHALAGVGNSKYDMMLVDYHLPDYTGIEFILACKELGIDSKAIIMTADLSNELKQLCQENGVKDMITKPFKMADLMAIINEA